MRIMTLGAWVTECEIIVQTIRSSLLWSRPPAHPAGLSGSQTKGHDYGCHDCRGLQARKLCGHPASQDLTAYEGLTYTNLRSVEPIGGFAHTVDTEVFLQHAVHF